MSYLLSVCKCDEEWKKMKFKYIPMSPYRENFSMCIRYRHFSCYVRYLRLSNLLLLFHCRCLSFLLNFEQENEWAKFTFQLLHQRRLIKSYCCLNTTLSSSKATKNSLFVRGVPTQNNFLLAIFAFGSLK